MCVALVLHCENKTSKWESLDGLLINTFCSMTETSVTMQFCPKKKTHFVADDWCLNKNYPFSAAVRPPHLNIFEQSATRKAQKSCSVANSTRLL